MRQYVEFTIDIKPFQAVQLILAVDNFGGVTVVKCISAGNGDGILDIDWGVGKSFIKLIRKKLDSHIIEIMKET